MHDDRDTTVWQLRQEMAHFVAERDWEQFHDPKNHRHVDRHRVRRVDGALPVADQPGGPRSSKVPRGEWPRSPMSSPTSCRSPCRSPTAAGSTLTQALRTKMDANRRKYPVEKFKGKYR